MVVTLGRCLTWIDELFDPGQYLVTYIRVEHMEEMANDVEVSLGQGLVAEHVSYNQHHRQM